MAYFAPFVDDAGLHLPAYNDVFQYLLTQYAAIYGQGIVADISTSDVQSISIFALMIMDAYNTAQAVFNGMSPQNAVGIQQDALYLLNGITRDEATFSTAPGTVHGTVGFTLVGRVAQDQNGNLWTIPTVTIPTGGVATIVLTCQTPGPVTAGSGQINIKNNPTAGWTSVTNTAAATPGAPIETDSNFRARQVVSVALPSQTEVTGTIAALGQLAGVTRVAQGIPTPGGPGTSVENPTGAADSWGNPAHSISMVVEGGNSLDVATAIYNNKTPGALTNGSTTVNVTDPITGAVMGISFYFSTAVPIFVAVTLTPLPGYTTATTIAIQNAIAAYLNTLGIGELVSISALTAAAMAVNPNLSNPIFSITLLEAGLSSGSESGTDININFHSNATGNPANVAVTT